MTDDVSTEPAPSTNRTAEPRWQTASSGAAHLDATHSDPSDLGVERFWEILEDRLHTHLRRPGQLMELRSEWERAEMEADDAYQSGRFRRFRSAAELLDELEHVIEVP